MKNIICLATAITAALTASALAQAQEKAVAFRVPAEKPVRYLTAFKGNQLKITGSEIGKDKKVTLIDTNGGDVAEGDYVQIKHVTADERTTFCAETGDSFVRIPKGEDPATQLKVRKTEQGISLQTASGKFVTVPATTKDIGLTDDETKAVVLEIVERAASGAGAASSAPAAGGTQP